MLISKYIFGPLHNCFIPAALLQIRPLAPSIPTQESSEEYRLTHIKVERESGEILTIYFYLHPQGEWKNKDDQIIINEINKFRKEGSFTSLS